MLKDFFKLDEPYQEIDKSALAECISACAVHDALYRPDVLDEMTFEEVSFQNVSFSKTLLDKLTFKRCSFTDCLFINATFKDVRFHGCEFKDCNFFQAKLESVYGKPKQFRKAITEKRFANIAVHLYQQLLGNYYQDSQREYKNEAEYYGGHWKRINDRQQAKAENLGRIQYLPRYVGSWLYGYLLGYGFRFRNTLATTAVIFSLMVLLNHLCANYLFSCPTKVTIVKSLYFTITTMATLGSSGYSPDTDTGYLFVIMNVVIGVGIVTAMSTAIVKKVIR